MSALPPYPPVSDGGRAPRRLRRRGVRVLIVLVVALFLLALYAALNYAVLHGPVDARSLESSVGRAAGTGRHGYGEGCERQRAPGTWVCEAWDEGQSGTVRYRVQVESDSSCWSGRLLAQPIEGPMPERLEGCVFRWD